MEKLFTTQTFLSLSLQLLAIMLNRNVTESNPHRKLLTISGNVFFVNLIYKTGANIFLVPFLEVELGILVSRKNTINTVFIWFPITHFAVVRIRNRWFLTWRIHNYLVIFIGKIAYISIFRKYSNNFVGKIKSIKNTPIFPQKKFCGQ